MIPYDADMRPCRHENGSPVGNGCPVCGKLAVTMRGEPEPYVDPGRTDWAGDPGVRDGSVVMRCDRCRAVLRMNPHGFVFLGGGL